jgi:hypothetical protein
MIKLYVGNLGAGKTLHMVRDLMEQMKRGRKVISNTPIRFFHNKRLYQSITVSDSKEFLSAVINSWNATIAIDELAVFFPANFWNRISGELIYKFAQSRKMRVDFYGTTQGWGHTIKRIRDLTNLVVMCSRRRFFLPMPSFKRWKDKSGKLHKAFNLSRPYLFKGTTFWPEFFRHSILDYKKRKFYTVDTDIIYPSEAKRVFQAYNTYFRVKGSALTRMKGIIENYKPPSGNNEELIQEDVTIDADEFSGEQDTSGPSMN